MSVRQERLDAVQKRVAQARAAGRRTVVLPLDEVSVLLQHTSGLKIALQAASEAVVAERQKVRSLTARLGRVRGVCTSPSSLVRGVRSPRFVLPGKEVLALLDADDASF